MRGSLPDWGLCVSARPDANPPAAAARPHVRYLNPISECWNVNGFQVATELELLLAGANVEKAAAQSEFSRSPSLNTQMWSFLRVSVFTQRDSRRRRGATLAASAKFKSWFVSRKIKELVALDRHETSAGCSPFTFSIISAAKPGFSLWEILERIPDIFFFFFFFQSKQTLWDLWALTVGKWHVCQHVGRHHSKV